VARRQRGAVLGLCRRQAGERAEQRCADHSQYAPSRAVASLTRLHQYRSRQRARTMGWDSATSCANIAFTCAAKPRPRITALISSLCRKLRQSVLVEPMLDHTPSMQAVLA